MNYSFTTLFFASFWSEGEFVIIQKNAIFSTYIRDFVAHLHKKDGLIYKRISDYKEKKSTSTLPRKSIREKKSSQVLARICENEYNLNIESLNVHHFV